jgi:hypothetical protein
LPINSAFDVILFILFCNNDFSCIVVVFDDILKVGVTIIIFDKIIVDNIITT